MSLNFDEIYSEIAPMLYCYLRRLCGSDSKAEDILQETFLRFHLKLQEGIEITHYRPWLFRVATNIVTDVRRTETRAAIREENYFGRAQVIDIRGQFENRQLLKESLEHLSPRMKQVLLLSAEGFSYREIADITNVEVPYVGVLLQRARISFKKYYEQKNEHVAEKNNQSRGF